MTAARLAPLALTVLAGCDPGSFRAETELHDDGSVSRTVLQRDPGKGWERTRSADPPDGFSWSDPLGNVPPDAAKVRDTDGPALASGRFPSAADLPGHVVLRLDDLPTTELARDVEVTDFGVLTVYDWTETLTPGTDPVRMERARRDLLDFWAWYGPAAIEAALPQGTDASRLAEWVNSVGDHATADAQAAFFAANGTGVGDFASLYRRGVMLAKGYGLHLPPHPPRDEDSHEAVAIDRDAPPERAVSPHATAVRAFAREVIAAHVDGPGRPLTEEELGRAVALAFNGGPRGASLEGAAKAASEQVFAGRFGSVKSGREAMVRPIFEWLGTGGIFGLYGGPYVYRHRQPGLLLSTNGDILDGGEDGTAEVLFRFSLADSHPFGRPMTCRSVVLHLERQRDLLGESPVSDRTTVLRFLDRMDDPDAREACEAALRADDRGTLRKLLP